jgi:conjugative transfer signal peptidase TraF
MTPTRSGLRRRRCVVMLGVLIPLGIVAFSGAGGRYRLNLTASAPIGLWRPVPGASLKPGAAVVACPAETGPSIEMAIDRNYLGPGDCPGGFAPLLKRLAGVPGDVVELSGEGVIINGGPLQPAPTVSEDQEGRPVRHYPWGRYELGPNQFWLISTRHPRSFDSRYFGPVERDQIKAVVVPALIWGEW